MRNSKKFIIIGDATCDSTIEALELFKDSGIDTFVLYPNDADHYGAIERCKSVGLDVYIFGGSLVCESNKEFFPDAIGIFPNFISKYQKEKVDLNKYEQVTGLYMIDEPSAKFFRLIKDVYIPWFNKNYAGKKVWHVNLLPSYASDEALGIDAKYGKSKFETYIFEYANDVLSKVNGIKTIGVDHYPLRKKEEVISLSDEWLFDLAVVGAAAKQVGAIYSVCIQAYCDSGQKKVDCTGDIRFQLYTAMAFGASMFEFYAYSTSHNTLAMLNEDGTPSDIYYSSRDAIREIRAFEKVYLSYEWKGVKCYLPPKTACKAFDNIKNYQSNRLQGIKDVKVSRQTIVSEFDNSGKKAYMVVNYGMPMLSNSNIVEITFDNAVNISVYQNGRKDSVCCTDNKTTLFLEAGQGVFIVVEN